MQNMSNEKITSYATGLKILSPKQMIQRLPITLTQVKCNTSENSLKWSNSYHILFVLSKINY